MQRVKSILKQEKSEIIFKLALGFLIILGIILRARHYLAGRSLWLDEAMLAINIINHSFFGLTQQPLEYDQGAPIGFVFALKGITLLLGDSEYAFRLFSLLAGCLSLILMAFLAKKQLKKAGALVALALFASTNYLIYYSAETKQYMGDVLATLILLLLFTKLLEPEPTSKDFLLF